MILALAFLAASVPDTALYESVLRTYVRDDGRVDYAGLRANRSNLAEFLRQVAETSPEKMPSLFPNREHRLAYWMNAYNALVLDAFAREYPEKRTRLTSLLGKYQFFYRTTHRIGGRERTLDDIESKSIRSEGDPRIHFAIVCASASCPRLSRTAFTGANVDTELERLARQYWEDPRNFRMDEARGELTLPKILDWFAKDFGGSEEKVLEFVARYRSAEAARLRSRRWRIRYFEYDWSPNDVSGAGSRGRAAN